MKTYGKRSFWSTSEYGMRVKKKKKELLNNMKYFNSKFLRTSMF